MRLWDASARVASSRLAYPEGRAALATARRLRRLGNDYRGALASFESLFRELHVVEVDADLARHAGDLAEIHALRGYDAVHLASALALGVAAPLLVSWDRDVAHAARAVGLAVAPPVS